MDLTLDKPKSFPVLLVEDNPGDARLVREMLLDASSTEFDVRHVDRLADARQKLMENDTGVVLLDLSLPDARRLEALMQLRAAAPDVPIVILSGLQDELLAVKAVQEGAQDYLIKGRVDGEGLSRSINYAIERKQAEMKLAHRAMHDPLTGLPNRVLFLDRLTHAVAWSKRHRSTFAVLFVDLDRFKLINDTLGHETGDQVLVEVAHRLEDVLRSSDTAARFGGDEFIVLCEDISDDEQTIRIAERIIASIEQPLELENDNAPASASWSPPTRRPNPRSSSARPTQPCTGPRSAAFAASFSTASYANVSLNDAKSSKSSRTRSSTMSSAFSISRRSTCGPAGSLAWRHWSVGTTHSGDCCPRQTSSRWQRRPG